MPVVCVHMHKLCGVMCRERKGNMRIMCGSDEHSQTHIPYLLGKPVDFEWDAGPSQHLRPFQMGVEM